VPAEPNIVDPPGDANYINNNQTGGGSGNNHTTPADASSLADILAVWFTHDAEKISVHVQTEAPQPSSGAAYIVFFYANADECLFAEFAIAAPSYQSDSYAEVEDSCAGVEPGEGEVISEEGPDGTGIITATFPRSYSASFEDGAVIGTPRIEMRNLNGGPASLRGPTIDNTDPGTDYMITGGEFIDKPKPPKAKPKPKPKPKKKDKKKGKSKSCAPYEPGEQGAEKPTVVVTDAATEEAPATHAFSLGPYFFEGITGEVPTETVNVQVDTTSESAGLYVTFEFQPRRDYDLWAYWPTGEEAASAHGFNPLVEAKTGNPDVSNTSSNHAGESTDHSESLVGVITPDCGGYTIQAQNYFGEGGDFELKLWLGEGKEEPKAPGG
jgi:hypothetical protein